ncbi:stage ii sporulation protein e (spoiie) [Lucifera butyrica]|uniref:Stage ii sporulation protein e (Spoiie) n=1 Tax=Lucifera butyrica TaxID=1351585 RepID=A0A498R5M0_9FIRM|nr:stage II sporulation protein E [Lucifera butyrica]VBB06405.1 stage ii sporulation protein e (spoiie) [Lucifera butyrica]
MPKMTVIDVPDELLAPPEVTSGKGTSANKWNPGRLWQKIITFASTLLQRNRMFLILLAFLLGRVSIMGELAPFGLAFFAAVAQNVPKQALLVAFWTVAGVISAGHYTEAGMYILSIGAYFYLRGRLVYGRHKLWTGPAFIFGAALLSGLGITLWQQANLYAVVLNVLDASLCMVLAGLFLYGVPAILEPEWKCHFAGESLLCTLAIAAIAVAGLGSATVWGYSIRNMAGSFLVALLALGGGAGTGAAAGVVVGLVVGLTENNVLQDIAFYALSGLLAGAFRSLGRFAVILGYILGSLITVVYFGQAWDFSLILTESTLAAALVLTVPVRKLETMVESIMPAGRELCQGRPALSPAADKLNNIADMFTDLAGTFGNLSNIAREKFKEEEMARTLAVIGEQVCETCEKRDFCWNQDFYRTYQAVMDMLVLAESGKLSVPAMPAAQRNRCVKSRELVDKLNAVAERNRIYGYWQQKIIDCRQVVTEQMRATAAILGNLAQEIKKEPGDDQRLAKWLQQKALSLDCPLTSVRVTRQENSTLVEAGKAACQGTQECIHTLLPLITNLLGEPFTLQAECGNMASDRKCKLIMRTARRYRLETGMACRPKEEGNICGDTCTVVSINQGKTALMLSDGMGTGSKAAGESGTAVHFLEKLLSVGFDVNVAVKTVNSMLLLRMPEENFVTVDMAIIDNLTGETDFLKIGSAPSFIKRVREIFTIESASLPIGILNQIEIEPVKAKLVAGDTVIMVSDGVTDLSSRGGEKEIWLTNFLRRMENDDPQQLAERILQRAVELAGAKIRDDMTVLVAKVVKEETEESF